METDWIMSLIATLLYKPIPPIHHSARAFNVDCYRDKIDPDNNPRKVSELERNRMSAADKFRQGKSTNRTCKADGRYIAALKSGPKTVKQIAPIVGRSEHHVRQHLLILEAKSLIRPVGIKTHAVIWGLAGAA